MLPEPRLPDKRFVAGQRCTGDRIESFVKRHVDRIEQRGDFPVRARVMRRRLPESRAVEMQTHAAFARRCEQREQLVPVRKLRAEFALRQFDQQRGNRFGERGHIVARHQPDGRPDRYDAQPVDEFERLRLVHHRMRRRMHCDRRGTGTVGPNAQRDLLCERAAGHEHGCRFAEFGGDARFETCELLSLTVQVAGQRRGVESGERCEHLARRALDVVRQRPGRISLGGGGRRNPRRRAGSDVRYRPALRPGRSRRARCGCAHRRAPLSDACRALPRRSIGRR